MHETLFRMDGKVAVVTGAGFGIGRSIALGLAAHGAHVVCLDRNAPRCEETVGLIRQSRLSGELVVGDVAEEASVDLNWAEIAARHRRIDILVNNAGITTIPTRTHEFSIADWDRVMSVNLRGVFLTTRQALRLMLPGPGSIINIASIAALRGYYPGFPALSVNYTTSKAGVIGLTLQVAGEYAKEHIRANAIAPGWHGGTDLGAARRAAMTAADLAKSEQALAQRIPMGHRAKPDDLVGLAVYLASDASHYMTGQVIAHDGGWAGLVA